MAVKVPTWLENKEGDRVISISKIHKDVEHLSITAEDGKFGTFCNLFYAGSDRFYSFVARNVHLFFCCCIQMFIYYFCCQIWMFFILFPNRSKCFFSKILLLPDRIFKKNTFYWRIQAFLLIFFFFRNRVYFYSFAVLESPTLSYCFLNLLRITVAYLDLH